MNKTQDDFWIDTSKDNLLNKKDKLQILLIVSCVFSVLFGLVFFFKSNGLLLFLLISLVICAAGEDDGY